MKIRYKGLAGIRIIERGEWNPDLEEKEKAELQPYQWDASNGYVQDVEEGELIENLLTYPTETFEEAPEEYLAKLAEMGIGVSTQYSVISEEGPGLSTASPASPIGLPIGESVEYNGEEEESELTVEVSDQGAAADEIDEGEGG